MEAPTSAQPEVVAATAATTATTTTTTTAAPAALATPDDSSSSPVASLASAAAQVSVKPREPDASLTTSSPPTRSDSVAGGGPLAAPAISPAQSTFAPSLSTRSGTTPMLPSAGTPKSVPVATVAPGPSTSVQQPLARQHLNARASVPGPVQQQHHHHHHHHHPVAYGLGIPGLMQHNHTVHSSAPHPIVSALLAEGKKWDTVAPAGPGAMMPQSLLFPGGLPPASSAAPVTHYPADVSAMMPTAPYFGYIPQNEVAPRHTGHPAEVAGAHRDPAVAVGSAHDQQQRHYQQVHFHFQQLQQAHLQMQQAQLQAAAATAGDVCAIDVPGGVGAGVRQKRKFGGSPLDGGLAKRTAIPDVSLQLVSRGGQRSDPSTFIKNTEAYEVLRCPDRFLTIPAAETYSASVLSDAPVAGGKPLGVLPPNVRRLFFYDVFSKTTADGTRPLLRDPEGSKKRVKGVRFKWGGLKSGHWERIEDLPLAAAMLGRDGAAASIFKGSDRLIEMGVVCTHLSGKPGLAGRKWRVYRCDPNQRLPKDGETAKDKKKAGLTPAGSEDLMVLRAGRVYMVQQHPALVEVAARVEQGKPRRH